MFAVPTRALLHCTRRFVSSNSGLVRSRYAGACFRGPVQVYFSTNNRVAMAAAAFERLIRFEDGEGKTVYGNLEEEVPTREIEGRSVEVVEGDVESGFRKTGGK